MTAEGVQLTESYAAGLLDSLGVDVRSPDTEATPGRFARALAELTAGLAYPLDAGPILARTFEPPSQHPQMILMTGIEFTSVCEHHMLPFFGAITLAYLPAVGARIVGASKLARLVQFFAARPQIQERLGTQIVNSIGVHLDSQGAACLIAATHTCMTIRGVKQAQARMITNHLTGAFLDVAAVRGEFLALAAR